MAFLIGFFNTREIGCVKHNTVSYEETVSYKKIEAFSILHVRGKRSVVIIILSPAKLKSYYCLDSEYVNLSTASQLTAIF